jgi:hypothetical protein
MTSISTPAGQNKARPSFQTLLFLGGLCLVLFILFHRVVDARFVLFSNDGPLGAASADYLRAPSSFLGVWQDLNSVGSAAGSYPLSLTGLLFWVLGPLAFSKFYVPLTLLYLGCSAAFLFRSLGLAPIAWILGGVAASLNSSFFSAACWGVGTHDIAIGSSYLALGLLAGTTSRRGWIKVPLAGLLVGMGVTEGADIGAIFSMLVAAALVYGACVLEGNRAQNLTRSFGKLALVAGFAAFFATQAISTLINTQIKGVVGTQQDSQTKAQHWDFATQWSLPKREALGLVVPGLFGYRMDTADGGVYWGAVGRDPNWDRYFANGKQGQPPTGYMRFSGGGIYSGILVVLVAAWATLQSFRKKDSVFALPTRRWIWFWFAVAFVSLLLAFGRFAPFYQLLYALPYFSTIRNPAKFTHVVNWALVVLFAYGVHGLWRRYMESSNNPSTAGLGSGSWWQRLRGFDRRWAVGCLIGLGVAVLGWLIFASNREGFERYLQEVQFDSGMAQSIASFSIGQIGLFLFFFAAAIILMALVLSGKFRGPQARWGAVLMGLFLAVDLGRANQPWIITWDYKQKYASNPIIDKLRQQPYQHRVASLPRWLLTLRLPQQLAETEQYFRQLYSIEWAQHHFLYYNVQSLDIVQMPRMPEDLAAFETALTPASPRGAADYTHFMEELSRLSVRRWELTNTRYLLGAASFVDFLNQQFDPTQHRFHVVEHFQIAPKPGIAQPSKLEQLTAVPATNGPFALIEFTGALPRAKLYSNWQVSTNDAAALRQLADASFNSEQTVLVAGGPQPSAAAGTNQAPSTVEFASYAPKDVVLNAKASSPSILLLNDHYDPNWKVYVDAKPESLLRCNYLMRGVHLAPGTHKVEFRFEPSTNTFYVSLAAIGIGLLLCGLLVVVKDPPSPAGEDLQQKTKETKKSPEAVVT